MNKKEFIKELSKLTNYDEEKCTIINSVLEDNFIIGKKNKDKIISELVSKLNIDTTKANEIYNNAINLLTTEIKKKIINPFKDQD